MPARIFKKQTHGLKSMNELEFGEIAIIEDEIHDSYNERIVVRSETDFVSLGFSSGEGFKDNCTLLVRVLKPGELIEIY
jgi:hypothetical protein